MTFLVAILIIALIAAVAFAVVQRPPAGVRGLGRPRSSTPGRRVFGGSRRDPMAAAVAEHARALDPEDVVVAEQRLRAEARQVAAGLQAEASRTEHARAAAHAPHGADPRMNGAAGVAHVNGSGATNGHGDPAGGTPRTDPRLDEYIDPVTGARTDGYGDPATDPRYDDPRYDGRLAADYVDPNEDARRR